MRAIFVVLVVLNLVLLGARWTVGGAEPPASSAVERSAPVGPPVALLSEAAQDLPPRRPDGATALEAVAPPLCTLIGPYESEDDARDTEYRLRALDVDAQLEAVEVADGPGYWVHLMPELSQKEALRRLHELQAKQIDSYIIPRGELANGISFGMFSRKTLALARQDALQDQGYDAKIHEIERTHRELWLSMPSTQASALDIRLWEELLPDDSSLRRRQNLCPGVASE